MNKRVVPSHLAISPQEYERLHIKKGEIEPWEDGFRTDGSKGTYEWWYFDAHLSDGSKTVIVFYTKPLVDVDKPLAPYIAFTLDKPDGSHLEKEFHTHAQAFSSAKESCDVRIGANIFKGDLHSYSIHVEIDDLVCDVTLSSTVPPWRPEAGYLFFGERSEHYFAWLPSVPQGDVQATISIAGDKQVLTGIGYHDHNWGNISPVRLMNNWYWARGKIGDYTLIASYITAEKKYGYKTFPVFMLAHNGKILADDDSKVSFSASDFQTDGETGRPVANTLVYDYKDGTTRYLLNFKREKTILRMKLIETIHGIQRFLARLIGFDGKFLRFTGHLTIDHYEGEKLVASERDEAIWELMYFGPVRQE
jgi:CrtC N-terminal lipocalin domain